MPFEQSVFVPLNASSAEATLAICQRVLRGVAEADYHKPTVCTEFDVTQLADHLIGSVTYLGAAAGAAADPVSGPLETRVATAAQAIGQQVVVFDEVAQHVLGVARQIITPEARGGGSFADPTEAGPDAGLLDRLVAFTGRAL
jgi:hypothetical protein